MKLIIVIVTSMCALCVTRKNEYTLSCKPKSGCHIAKCDPVPLAWGKGKLDHEDYLKRNEYPIICDQNEVKAENESLLERIENLERNINKAKQEARRNNANQNYQRSIDIAKSENKMRHTAFRDMAVEIAKFRAEMQQYSRQQAKKVELELRNELRDNFDELNKTQKAALSELQNSCDKKVATAIQNLRMEIQRNMSKMEKRLESFVKSSIADAKRRPIQRTVPRTNAPTPTPRTIPRTAPSVMRTTESTSTFTNRQGDEKCQLQYRGSCFWFITHWRSYTYEEGETKCGTNNGKLANIYSKEHYDKVVDMIRRNMGTSEEYTAAWLGLNYDPLIDQLYLNDGSNAPYANWFPGYPDKGQVFEDRKRLYVYVELDKESTFQGMINNGPIQQSSFPSIVCES